MHLPRVKTLFYCLMLLLYCLVNCAYAVQLDTQLSSDNITFGETVTITIAVGRNTENISPDLSLLEKDFRILGRNFGSTINMVNGVTTSQTFWWFKLQPRMAGDLIIPEIKYGADTSVPQKLHVEKNAQYQPGNNQHAATFVQAELSTLTPYFQSQLIYTFKLYYQSPLKDPRIDIPTMDDIILVPLDDSKSYQTTIKGSSYNVVEKRFALFPKKTGRLLVPAIHLAALSFDTSGNYANDPFNVGEAKILSLQTKEFSLDVRDIPAIAQGSTWLPAQSVSVIEQWSDTIDHWQTGSPVTRTITIAAQGLRADQIPDLTIANMPGVNIYSDTAKRRNIKKDNTVTGILEQKVTYIPTTAEFIIIPELKLHWWDLKTNNNAIATLNTLAVKIKSGANSATNTSTIAPANRISKSNVSGIIAATKNQNSPFYFSIWFWLAALLFILWVVTLCLFRPKRTSDDPMINENAGEINFQIKPAETKIVFKQACLQGNPFQAKEYILDWGKQKWPDMQINLAKLRSLIDDPNFNTATVDLEQAVYAKNSSRWNGEVLLQAFKIVERKLKRRSVNMDNGKVKQNRSDNPLPPLNP
jgi:hypothetical protein